MQEYEEKRKNLFDSLADAEKTLKGSILDQSDSTQKINLNKRKFLEESVDPAVTAISKFRNKESLFKRPEIPLEKCLKPRVLPDYKKNPHKWTKYSLEDADISDRMNTTAAFAFLKEMEIKKQESDSDSDSADETRTIVFNKPLKKQLKLIEAEVVEEEPPKLKGTKFVMSEYDFGKKMKKEKKTRTKKSTPEEKPSAALTLSHLCEDEDEPE